MQSTRLKFCAAALCLTALAMTSGCATLMREKKMSPPAGEWRGLHLLNYRDDAKLDELAAMLPDLAKMGINVLIIEVNYGLEFESHPELRQGERQISKAGARKFAARCRELGIRLIPQFSCVGHQSWAGETFPLLTKYPELDLTPGAYPGNKGKVGDMNFYCREWDPYNPKVYEIVLPLLDEIIDAFEADALHVGMDEVFLLDSPHAVSTRDKDPAVAYAKAVNDLHAHIVGKRGIEMLIWGDRFIDGNVYKLGAWEASENGTAPAIDLVPKDIIMCPWHYEPRETYPSVQMFVEKGFRTWPATWNKVDAAKALIRESYKVDDPKMLGIMFTTWTGNRDWRQWEPMVEGLKTMREQKLGF